ncbi:MAG: FtsW/RodA/SpoVE family cell cycle protein [Clostridiales bacterium]|nr:FtsW/RodA/SpoVE family cell cycle protein [Clostridiales bacterium]
MAEKKVKSIIPDVPLYGTPGNAAGSGASKPQAPAKKNPSKAHAPVRKQAPAKPFADPKTGKITDIESLIEPPPKPDKEGINAATIEQAVKSSNIPMILMIFALIVFGLVILYSVSGPDAYGQFKDSSWFLTRQIRFTVAGLIVMFIISFIPIDFFRQKWIAFGAYVLSLGLALATIALGVGREHGAARWINIGPIQLQSSEIIKVALIVAFAGYRSVIAYLRKEGRIREPKTKTGKIIAHTMIEFIIPIGLCVLVDVVILLQPHLSCFIIVAAVIFMCALVSEIPARSWLYGIIVLLAVAIVGGAIAFAVVPAAKRERFMKNYAHVFKRIAIFTADDEELDNEDEGLTRDDTRQVDNAHNALGSGGMWGVGLGNSRSKYNYVSEAQNDYIFSIYIEETGFVGGVILMMMYLVIFFMCLAVCWRAKDVFSRTIATGCTALIFVEVLMNISVELQVIPATGVTLPFVSYGGTAQVTLLIAYGLILSVSRSGTVRPEKKSLKSPVKLFKRGA